MVKSFGTCYILQRVVTLVMLCLTALIMEEEQEMVGRQFNSFEELELNFSLS